MGPLVDRARVRHLRRRLAVLRATHRWRPSRIRLARSGNVIHVDTSDPRGWEIVLGLGRGHQPALIALWRNILESAHPTLVIDVGANYGEVVLSGHYPEGTTVVAVEPNPRVATCLRRGIAEHPDAGRIDLHQVIASDQSGGTAELCIDPMWSGSASVALDETGFARVAVRTQKLDDLCPDVGSASSIVLKVDVEGWESQVLAGASELLERAGSVTALVEFEPDHLRRAGTDPSVLFSRLLAIGPCHSITWEGAIEPVLGCPEAATDLLATSNPNVAEWLANRIGSRDL